MLKVPEKTKIILIVSLALLLALIIASVVSARKKHKDTDVKVFPLPREDEGEIVIPDEFELKEKEEEEKEEESGGGIESTPGIEESFKDTSPEAEVEEQSLEERLNSIEGLSLEADTGYIFVGDSRFVHMNEVCNISGTENLFVVAKVGEGYSWFSQTAMQQIKRIISSGLYSKWKIIICLGVNDLDALDKYVSKYEQLKNDYDISLVSVNPITNYGNLSNTKIEKFNSGIKKLDLPYIDTYRLLMVTGFTTTDGLHYNADTSKKIFNGILLGLQDENPRCLTGNAVNKLDKTSLAKKNSLQKEILGQNKYVPKQTVTKTPAAAAAAQVSAPVAPEQKPAEIPATQSGEGDANVPQFPVGEDGEIDQAYLDTLYGIKRDEEGNVIEEEGERQEEQSSESEEERGEEEERSEED